MPHPDMQRQHKVVKTWKVLLSSADLAKKTQKKAGHEQ